MTKNIVIGQKDKPSLVQRAKELRRNMTPEEQILWEQLRTNQVGGFHFRRQHVIGGYIVDFYCHRARLVVEVDGGVHTKQVIYDEERDSSLRQRMLRIMRFSNTEIQQDISSVLEMIAAACLDTGEDTRECCQEDATGDKDGNEEQKKLFSEEISAGSRTYFFDVKKSKEGTPYLVISESRKVGKNYLHSRVMIFEENVELFASALNKAFRFLESKRTKEG